MGETKPSIHENFSLLCLAAQKKPRARQSSAGENVSSSRALVAVAFPQEVPAEFFQLLAEVVQLIANLGHFPADPFAGRAFAAGAAEAGRTFPFGPALPLKVPGHFVRFAAKLMGAVGEAGPFEVFGGHVQVMNASLQFPARAPSFAAGPGGRPLFAMEAAHLIMNPVDFPFQIASLFLAALLVGPP